MTDALVEAVRSAMTSYLLENVSPDTVRVALQAIEAAGYRVVPVEATDERLTAMAKTREGDQPYYILDMYRDLYTAAIGGAR